MSRTSLRKVRKLIKGYLPGFTSLRDLGRFAGISHVSVLTFLRQLKHSGFLFEELASLDDSALRTIIHPAKRKPAISGPLADFEKTHNLLRSSKKTGIT